MGSPNEIPGVADGPNEFKVWLKNLEMLVVPAVVMGAILVSQACTPSSKSASRPNLDAQKGRQKVQDADDFLPRASMLESQGLVLSPWRASSSTLDSGDSSGWFNLAYLIVVFWFASTSVSSFFRTGSVFLDRGFYLISAFQVSHELALALSALYGLFCLAYVLQLVAVSKLFPHNAILIIQGVLEAVLFLSALVYSISDDAVQRWPFSQRLGLMMQSSVFILKMHSYLAVNRSLAIEAEEAAQLEGSGPSKASIQQAAEAQIQSTAAGASKTSSHIDAGNADTQEKGHSMRNRGIRTGGRARSDSRGRAGTRLPQVRDWEDSEAEVESGSSSSASDSRSTASEPEDENEEAKSASILPTTGTIDVKSKSTTVRTPEGLDFVPASPPSYPNNVTFANFIIFSFMPTLVYLPTYPTTKRIRLFYCIEKSLLALGLTLVGMTIIAHQVVPVISRMPGIEPLEAVANLIIPFISITLIVFFIIFECILNFLAEVTYMADRTFYRDWWNATSYTAFSRDWNIPVSAWLRKHVYDELQDAGFRRETARLATFGISIVLHELVAMGVAGVMSPWLAVFSLLQFPLFSLMRSSFFRGKRLGNLVFWLGLVVGVPLIAVLYAQQYCAAHHDHCQLLKAKVDQWPQLGKSMEQQATCTCEGQPETQS